MRNMRRYFRLNVSVPAVIKFADENEVIRLLVPEVDSGHWDEKESSYDRELDILLSSLIEKNKLIGQVVSELLNRTNLICHAILLLAQGKSVYDEIERYKTYRGKTTLTDKLEKTTTLMRILDGFNRKLSFYFSLLDLALDKQHSEYISNLEDNDILFDREHLSWLEQKAAEGNLFARFLVSLNDKLTRHLFFLEQYRQEISCLLDKNSWPEVQLNLSAGGVGFVSLGPYPKFARLIVEFKTVINEQEKFFHMHGNIVSIAEQSEGYYVSVEFTDALEPVQLAIIEFLQYEETNQLIAWQQAQ